MCCSEWIPATSATITWRASFATCHKKTVLSMPVYASLYISVGLFWAFPLPENPQSVCPTASTGSRSSQLGSASVPDHRVSHPLGLQDPERIRASIRREALGNKRLMYDRRSQTESFWTFLNYPTVTSMWLMCWMQRTQPCLPKKRVGILSDVWNQDLADRT